jgi:hypothetical protein
MKPTLTLFTALLLAPLAALHAAEMPKPVNKPNIVFLLLAFQAAKATPGLDNVSVSVTATTAPAAPPAESGPRITVASYYFGKWHIRGAGNAVADTGFDDSNKLDDHKRNF